MTTYTFDATLWVWQSTSGPGSWHFITVPHDITDQIDDALAGPRGGFGSVRVQVTIGETVWRTSLFPSKEQEAFILPMKKAVRDAEKLAESDTARITIEVLE